MRLKSQSFHSPLRLRPRRSERKMKSSAWLRLRQWKMPRLRSTQRATIRIGTIISREEPATGRAMIHRPALLAICSEGMREAIGAGLQSSTPGSRFTDTNKRTWKSSVVRELKESVSADNANQETASQSEASRLSRTESFRGLNLLWMLA